MANKVLPVDQNAYPINILKLGSSVSVLAVGDPSTRVALPTGVVSKDCIRIASNTDCYIKLGESDVTATTSDTLFLAGVEYVTVASNQTHIAAIRVGVDGVLTVTEVY